MNDMRPIFSLTVHWLASVRPQFARWGDHLGFDWAHPLKSEAIPTWSDTPHREWLIGTAQILRRVLQVAPKSP